MFFVTFWISISFNLHFNGAETPFDRHCLNPSRAGNHIWMWNLGQGRYLALPILAGWSEQQPKHHWPAIPFTVISLSQSPSLLHDNSESIQPSWDQYETRDSWHWSPRSASQFLLLGSCSSLWCPLTSLCDNALATHTPPASQSGGAHTGLWALYHWAARTLCWAISLHNTRTKEPAGVGWWMMGNHHSLANTHHLILITRFC